MQKRITLACSIINFGGVGKILNFVASTLISEGWQVEVLSLRNEERPDFLQAEVTFSSIKKNESINRILWRFELISKIRKEIKEKGTTIICTFGSEPSVMVRLATLGLKNIIVISAERSDPFTLPTFWKKISSWAYRNSDYCIFQLEKQRDFYGDKIKHKSFVIPNAFIPKDEIKEIKERRKIIVSAGRFVYQKGYDSLIKAFVKVHKRHPDYALELYGGGSEKSMYETIIKGQQIEGFVSLFDYSQNITSIISESSVFVLSSRFEGIPNVLIEAMSIGIPTVSTDCTPGGPAFLTDNGRRGLLVAVDDIDAMADAICKIIENPELGERLAKEGKEICDILDEKVIAKQWVQMFTCIIKEQNGYGNYKYM